MQTCRRLASTASSTSRSASTASMHQTTHGRLSRSSSTASTSSAMTATSMGIPMPISRNLGSTSTVFGSPDQVTRAELETIAESLLAHVHFGPYHLASSPVPSSHLRIAMAAHRSNPASEIPKENTLDSSSSTPTLHPLGAGPSSRRHFEGKEGTHASPSSSSSSATTNNHPRARFTIGGPESERGRGMGRKSVGLSVRDVNHANEGYTFERERGREFRGRSGNVKGLQYS